MFQLWKGSKKLPKRSFFKPPDLPGIGSYRDWVWCPAAAAAAGSGSGPGWLLETRGSSRWRWLSVRKLWRWSRRSQSCVWHKSSPAHTLGTPGPTSTPALQGKSYWRPERWSHSSSPSGDNLDWLDRSPNSCSLNETFQSSHPPSSHTRHILNPYYCTIWLVNNILFGSGKLSTRHHDHNMQTGWKIRLMVIIKWEHSVV